jgi:glyoxylate reductase
VYVTRRIASEGLALLDGQVEYRVWEGELAAPRDVLLREAKRCDGLLTMLTERVDAELLDAAPTVRVVSNMAVGYDNINVPQCSERGVLVGTTPGVLTVTCAEFAMALLLAFARRVVEGDRYVRDGSWKGWAPGMLNGRDLHGATLGIVGLGAIGLEVAARAKAFGMRVVYHSRTRRREAGVKLGLEWSATLEGLLRQSDYVSLHVALTPETKDLIGHNELRMMPKHSVLINTARGPVVDQRALYEALRDGVIAGAALDVMEQEPMPLDDPLLTLPNVLVTPHIASASVATRRRMAEMAARNLLTGLRGEEMPHCLNAGTTRATKG